MNAQPQAGDREIAAAVRADVDRGLQIVGELKMLQDELDRIEARLEAAGLAGEQIELNDPEREGRQFLARGSAAIVPVVFTADLLVKSFQVGSTTYHKIIAALPPNHYVREFFGSVRTFESLYSSGKVFRAKAAELLGDDAPRFITACVRRDKEGVAKSAVKIDWQRAEEIKEGVAS
ncbi:MAG: hypothetical protein LC642_05295 [Verrucomicrobiaceae bacterium]|nr:hypothetical protein [Verrucomicrobiaceae bacterium]